MGTERGTTGCVETGRRHLVATQSQIPPQLERWKPDFSERQKTHVAMAKNKLRRVDATSLGGRVAWIATQISQAASACPRRFPGFAR
jgi:hypothetical protein